jgi:hypothetical protein
MLRSSHVPQLSCSTLTRYVVPRITSRPRHVSVDGRRDIRGEVEALLQRPQPSRPPLPDSPPGRPRSAPEFLSADALGDAVAGPGAANRATDRAATSEAGSPRSAHASPGSAPGRNGASLPSSCAAFAQVSERALLSLLVPTSGRPSVKFGRVGFGEAGNVDAEPLADSYGVARD